MEVIQWYSTGSVKPGEELDKNKSTKHCLFRLDELDRDNLKPHILEYIQNETIKCDVEFGFNIYNKHLSLRVSEDDTDEYRMKCLEQFALIMGIIEPGENIIDWIHKY